MLEMGSSVLYTALPPFETHSLYDEYDAERRSLSIGGISGTDPAHL